MRLWLLVVLIGIASGLVTLWIFARRKRSSNGGALEVWQKKFKRPLHISAEITSLLGEWFIVFLGAWLVAGTFLSLNPSLIPNGREFLSTIHFYHFWDWVSECGTCALWSPFNGGFPLMGDPSPGLLYPLVAVPVMLFGVVSGVKVAIFLSFFSVGLAVWWMGRLWRLSPLLRLWGAWMVMASGLVPGRLELGDMHTVLSVSALVWWFPTWWYLWKHDGRYAFLPFAWAVGMSILAARGYHLFGMFFALLWVALFCLWLAEDKVRLLRRTGAALLGGVLLASPVLLPLAKLMPYFVKTTDPAFKASQPFGNLLFNLLISDPSFYRSDILGKLPYPHLTFFFVGWIPFLLALYGVIAGFIDPRMRRYRTAVGVLFLWALLFLWLATGQPMRWLVSWLPNSPLVTFLEGFRHIEQVGALAIPPIIGLSMLGVEAMVREMEGWSLSFSVGKQNLAISFSLLLVIPLLFALRQGWKASEAWIHFVDYPDPNSAAMQFLAEAHGQWVAPVMGEHFWMEPTIAQHMKVLGIHRWWWKDWKEPKPRRKLIRSGKEPKPPEGYRLTKLSKGLYGAENPNVNYAYLVLDDGSTVPCEPSGWGGKLEIHCDAQQSGVLWVMEHPWPGWRAEVGGRTQEVPNSLPYIHFPIPAGDEVVRLWFLPTDVFIGLGLAALWILWQLWLGWRWMRSALEPAPAGAS